MPKRYAVQAGDHISWIAEKHGFSSYHTIWDDPANTGLRAVRPNPHQLVPGDEIVIPDKTYANLPLASDREHQITVRRDVLRLRLLLADVFGLPIADAVREPRSRRELGPRDDRRERTPVHRHSSRRP